MGPAVFMETWRSMGTHGGLNFGGTLQESLMNYLVVGENYFEVGGNFGETFEGPGRKPKLDTNILTDRTPQPVNYF